MGLLTFSNSLAMHKKPNFQGQLVIIVKTNVFILGVLFMLHRPQFRHTLLKNEDFM